MPRSSVIRRLLLCAALPLVFGGCGGFLSGGCSPDDSEACADDRLGCDGDPTDFMYLPECDLNGTLQVEVGHGLSAYEAVGDGGPEVHFGIQGGQHTFLGFRVLNAALDRYDQLRVTFWMGQGETCEAGPARAIVPDSCERDLGLRQVVLGGDRAPLLTGTDGVIEEFGYALFLGVPLEGKKTVVTVEVEDPCGQLGVGSASYVQP